MFIRKDINNRNISYNYGAVQEGGLPFLDRHDASTNVLYT